MYASVEPGPCRDAPHAGAAGRGSCSGCRRTIEADDGALLGYFWRGSGRLGAGGETDFMKARLAVGRWTLLGAGRPVTPCDVPCLLPQSDSSACQAAVDIKVLSLM